MDASRAQLHSSVVHIQLHVICYLEHRAVVWKYSISRQTMCLLVVIMPNFSSSDSSLVDHPDHRRKCCSQWPAGAKLSMGPAAQMSPYKSSDDSHLPEAPSFTFSNPRKFGQPFHSSDGFAAMALVKDSSLSEAQSLISSSSREKLHPGPSFTVLTWRTKEPSLTQSQTQSFRSFPTNESLAQGLQSWLLYEGIHRTSSSVYTCTLHAAQCSTKKSSVQHFQSWLCCDGIEDPPHTLTHCLGLILWKKKTSFTKPHKVYSCTKPTATQTIQSQKPIVTA